MKKIHVILTKENLDDQKLKGNKIVVVFDILLATSTITTVLEHGAKEVIPVMDCDEARKEALNLEEGNYLLVGEFQGLTIDGFLTPHPRALIPNVINKTVILSTTNGTVAIRQSATAKQVFIASLLNANSVARKIIDNNKDETILLVCSGSSGSFNIKDFYGVGYFLHCLLSYEGLDFELTDSANAAHQFYNGSKNNYSDILKFSSVGKMLTRSGMEKEIEFIANHDVYDLVPYVKDDKFIVLDRT